MSEKKEKINEFIAKLGDKDFKILFYVPDLKNQIAVSIYEIYKHVKTLNEIGYKAFLLTDNRLVGKNDKEELYSHPDWFEKSLQELPTISMKDGEPISPCDFLIIPEYFPSIMEQCKALPCEKIVLFQSYSLMQSSLPIGTSWNNFDMKKVLTTSDKMVDYLSQYKNETYEIKKYDVGIPSYFQYDNEVKSLFIPFLSRNQQDTINVIKDFYKKYPSMSWVSFEDMSGSNREEFAQKLKTAPISLWIDRVASFGTFPLESMTANCVCVGLVPDMIGDYFDSNNGIWTTNLLELPDLLFKTILSYIEDSLPVEIYEDSKKTAEQYNEANYVSSIGTVFGEYVSERIGFLTEVLKKENNIELSSDNL